MKFVAFLNSYSQGLSGGDACFLNVAKELGRRNDLLVVTSKLGVELCKARGIRAKFYLTSRENRFGNVYLTYFRRTLQVLLFLHGAELGVDIAYSSSDFLPDVLPAFLLKIASRKRLWVQKIFHIIPSERTVPHFFQRVSFFLVRRWADLVITDNVGLKEALLKRNGFQRGKVEFVPPGIDLKAVSKVVPSKEEYDGIFVGQLRKSKGIFDLIPIWKKVVQVKPKARLGIVGKDVQGNEEILRKEILKGRMGKNISVLGFQSRNEEIFSLMKSSRVLLLPSYEEGFGMVVAEALTCGMPVVSYRLPALEENFGWTINMVRVGDKDAFSGKVIRILSNRQSVRKYYRTVVKKFDTISVVNQEFGLIRHAYESAC